MKRHPGISPAACGTVGHPVSDAAMVLTRPGNAELIGPSTDGIVHLLAGYNITDHHGRRINAIRLSLYIMARWSGLPMLYFAGT